MPLSDLAKEVYVFELVHGELQVLLHMLEEHLIERLLAVSVNKTISVDTLRLVD